MMEPTSVAGPTHDDDSSMIFDRRLFSLPLSLVCALCLLGACSSPTDPDAGSAGDLGVVRDASLRDLGHGDVGPNGVTDLGYDASRRDVGLPPGPWRSRLYPEDWTPSYTHESGGFVHDFSYAGYRNSEAEPGVDASAPIFDVSDYGADAGGATDTTAAIQEAIDAAEEAGGGVVRLPEGLYRVDGELRVEASGVVLRGAGAEKTRLHFTATEGRTSRSHLTVGAAPVHRGDWPLAVDGATRSTELQLEDASELSVGDDVAIGWVISEDFVAEHEMEEYWQPFRGEWQPFFRREIVAVDTSSTPHVVTVDVPLRYPAKVRDAASVRREEGLVEEVGIESLSVGDATDWETAWSEDRIHAIELRGVADGWIRGVSSFAPSTAPTSGPGAGAHLQSGGILVRDSKRVTVTDSSMGRAQNRGPGGNGYLFEVRASSEVLFRDCVGRGGRHNFIQNWGFGATGIVWLRVRTEEGVLLRGPDSSWRATGSSEFHHSLAMANLIDSSVVEDAWEALNRKEYSSGAGHTATASVFWNTRGAGRLVSYQWERGYVIGTGPELDVETYIRKFDFGRLSGWTDTEPRDWREGLGRGSDLRPRSLFEDQLARRLGR